MADHTPVQFTFRPWRPEHESWDAFLAELEKAYAQYLEHYRHGVGAEPVAHERDPSSERDSELTPPL
jgi:hypothetical protein